MLDRRLLRLDPDGLVEHADLSGHATFHANDMVVDAQGRAFVGHFGFDIDAVIIEHGEAALLEEPGPPSASLVRVDPDGSVREVATDLRFPNGAVITPDGSTLIVGETLGGRLTAFELGADGSLVNRRVWADLGHRFPDGICLDADGHVWMADAARHACVLVAEGGEVLDVVETDQRCFACMLGGPEGRHLFMLTTASSLASVAAARRTGHVLVSVVDVPHAGLP
jgi:sugar lactone lactonase YvrE